MQNGRRCSAFDTDSLGGGRSSVTLTYLVLTSAASREYAWVLCNLCMSKVFLTKSASVGDDVEDFETFGLADADHVERALAGDTYRFPAVGTRGFTLAELDQPEAAVGPEHGNVRVLVVDLRDGEAAAL